jgi:AAA lid domain
MAAVKVLAHRRDTAANFGNGGEVDNLLREAKSRKEGRRTTDTAAARMDTELVRLLLHTLYYIDGAL